MEKKEAIVILWQNGDEKIADIYDTNADVSAALNTLIDGFEYPPFPQDNPNGSLVLLS